MKKVLAVALREFKATALTKAFLIGVVVFPFIMVGLSVVAPFLLTDRAPRIAGSIAIIDRTGGAGPGVLAPRVTAAALAEEFGAQAEDIAAAVDAAINDQLPGLSPATAAQARTAAGAAASGGAPELSVEVLEPDADVEAEKKPLAEGTMTDGGRLMLVVVPPDAIVRSPGASAFGGYELYLRSRLDDRISSGVESVLSRELLDARLAAAGLDASEVRPMFRVRPAETTTVTTTGERAANPVAQFIVPFGFLMLLWISAFTGGQYLLTTTIEEKSNRIMEVLLSAVSPMQLMVGKIMGQMAVGLLVLIVYAGVGVSGLVGMAMMDLINPANLVYLLVYFFLAFFVIAAMMAAVGSAVSDVHEAQSLIGPVMVVLVLPMIMWMPIMRDPNSPLAVTLSFVPIINPFVMVLRLAAATEPIPAWQIVASIAVGLAAVVFAAWAAAKIFRIGVLLYGKPPNFRTLVRWVRMA